MSYKSPYGGIIRFSAAALRSPYPVEAGLCTVAFGNAIHTQEQSGQHRTAWIGATTSDFLQSGSVTTGTLFPLWSDLVTITGSEEKKNMRLRVMMGVSMSAAGTGTFRFGTSEAFDTNIISSEQYEATAPSASFEQTTTSTSPVWLTATVVTLNISSYLKNQYTSQPLGGNPLGSRVLVRWKKLVASVVTKSSNTSRPRLHGITIQEVK